MPLCDPHSYADDLQPSVTHYRLELRVDFAEKRLFGQIELALDRPARGQLDLDTRDLAIDEVLNGAGEPLSFDMGPNDAILGQRLSIRVEGDRLQIRYRTSPKASALQWLSPEQTAGGQQPFVFTQCQAIHARSLMPCQDSPRVRSRFDVSLDVPEALVAVMAAKSLGETDGAPEGQRRFQFHMPQPIPSYLFAFAVGDLAKQDLNPVSAIYAEPSQLEAAAWEFAKVGDMMDAAIGLFGPYRWDRFDLLLMPPSFPYGGMENPRLTFLTPTLLAGDRSLVGVVAHELAHSWTGNLVTNASSNDFWLNEGFTVYAERRILEALEGSEETALHAALGYESLLEDIERLTPKSPALTHLRTDLKGFDPDDVYSSVPYEKGYLFVRRLEEHVGRDRFDPFLKAYIDHFAFQSITTQTFLDYVFAHFPELFEGLDITQWIDHPGVPEDAPRAQNEALSALRELAERLATEDPSAIDLSARSATELQVILSALPKDLPEAQFAALDAAFDWSESRNAEIRVAFVSRAVTAGYPPALERCQADLMQLGRMKYLRPLYGALIASGPTGPGQAKLCFERAKLRYHPVARAMVEGMLVNAKSSAP